MCRINKLSFNINYRKREPLIRRLFIASALAGAAGCGNRAVYESIQTQQRNECSKVHPAEYEACMEQADTSFEEYRRAREEALTEDPPSQHRASPQTTR